MVRMVRMWLENFGGDQMDVQQGTEWLYYITKKGLRPEGDYVR